MSAEDVRSCAEDKAASAGLTGIRLFKSIVRRVRQKISESQIIKTTPSGQQDELPAVTPKMERVCIEDGGSCRGKPRSPSKEVAARRFFGSMKAAAAAAGNEDRAKCTGYSSDSGTEKRRDSRVRIRQKLRSRSKSDSRRAEKKPKKILRPPPTYVYVRGLSGIPTQRIRVR